MSSRVGSSLGRVVKSTVRRWLWVAHRHTPVVSRSTVVAPVLGANYIATGLAVFLVLVGSGDTYVKAMADASLPALAGPAVLSAALGLTLILVGGRWPMWSFHPFVAMASAMAIVSSLLVQGDGSYSALVVLLLPPTVFGVFFFAWPVAALHVALVVTALSIAVRTGAVPLDLALALGVVILIVCAVSTVLIRLAAETESDPLTGLPNRQSFDRAIGVAIERAQRGIPLTVALIRVRPVLLAPPVGADDRDLALLQTSRTWAHQLTSGTILARYGDDEVGLALPRLGAYECADLVERLTESLPPSVACVAGITEWEPGDSRPALFQRADGALNDAERKGKTIGVRRPAADRRELMSALERGEFVVFYQPIVDLRTGLVIGAEALVRRHDPDRGLVPPDEFIPIAERTGAIVPIGHWVLQTACANAAGWRSATGEQLTLTVNVAGQELNDPAYVEGVAKVLAVTGLPADRLVLEVTESSVLAEEQTAVDALRQLREFGISIAVDDFGTGYSSLSRLDRLPVDVLKIDRSFVSAIAPGTRSAPVVAAVTALASALGLSTVAEGVEHPYQAALVARLGCHRAQGWLYGKPSPHPPTRTALPAISPAPARYGLPVGSTERNRSGHRVPGTGH